MADRPDEIVTPDPYVDGRQDDLDEPVAYASDVTWTAGTEETDQTDEDMEATRAQIEQTRADMSETINAIQQKLSPSNLAEQAKDTVRDATVGTAQNMVENVQDTAKGFGSSIVESIRQNPVPAALAGLGLGWLIMSNRQNQSRQSSRIRDYRYGNGSGYGNTGGYDYYPGSTYEGYQQSNQGGLGDTFGNAAQGAQQTVGQAVGQAQDTVGQVANQVTDTAGQVANQVQGTAQQVASTAQNQAEHMQTGLQQMLDEQPLVVGAVALALGAAVGLAIPETRKEQEIMGEARESLMDRAQQTVQDTAEKVQNVAQEAVGAAKDAAQQAAQDQGLSQESSTKG